MKHPLLRMAVLSAIVVLCATACDRPVEVGPTTEPTPTAAEQSGLIITLADDGQTVTIQVGERFLLKLGTAYDWTVISQDQDILRRVPNVLTVIGSQGLYEAHKAGRTQLAAMGDPLCRQSQPPCEAPSRGFVVDVVVE